MYLMTAWSIALPQYYISHFRCLCKVNTVKSCDYVDENTSKSAGRLSVWEIRARYSHPTSDFSVSATAVASCSSSSSITQQ
jgi:hypothetical protein